MDIKGTYEFLKRISKVLSSIPTDTEIGRTVK